MPLEYHIKICCQRQIGNLAFYFFYTYIYVYVDVLRGKIMNNKLDAILLWLLTVGLIGVGVFVSFYAVVFVLPLILLAVGAYALYVVIRIWYMKYVLKKEGYVFEFHNHKRGENRVIDAEFEILDEKNKK